MKPPMHAGHERDSMMMVNVMKPLSGAYVPCSINLQKHDAKAIPRQER